MQENINLFGFKYYMKLLCWLVNQIGLGHIKMFPFFNNQKIIGSR